MIIYNITTQVSWKIHDNWLEWMRKIKIPRMISTGIFSHHHLVKVLEIDDEDGPTYALQMFVNPARSFLDYKEKHLGLMENLERELWGAEIYSFSSLMEVIN